MKPHKKRETHPAPAAEKEPALDDVEPGKAEPDAEEPDKREEDLTDDEVLDKEERGELY